ncbi:beta-microseminoprotein-like [Narcine bancroftii]|uniref:beta-microseminoprotein-like n=1 Tax=Narcine bancroftii TaxID=1343680 RepID=UPI003831F9F0
MGGTSLLGMVMTLLVCIVLLLPAVPLSESACYMYSKEEGDDFELSEARDFTSCTDKSDGTIHEIGDSWKNHDCMKCTCFEEGYRCCEMFTKPVKFSKDCEAIFDRENCRYRVHRKDSPNVECPIWKAIGK